MSSWVAFAVAVVLVASGCTDSDRSAQERPTTTTTTAAKATSSTTTTVKATIATDSECAGIGAPPAQGEATWVAGGRLWAAPATAGGQARCLLKVPAGAEVDSWGGRADRVLIGSQVVLTSGDIRDLELGSASLGLSRPTGTSVLYLEEHRLSKRRLDGVPSRLDALWTHEHAAYHPAGQHIAVAGFLASEEGPKASLVIVGNRGSVPKDLVKNERAERFSDLAFTASGALLYVADHGYYTELHRLEIDAGRLIAIATLDKPAVLANVVTSPHTGGGVAWTAGECNATARPTLVAARGGDFFKLAGTPAERANPVGWLPDGTLLAIDGQDCHGHGQGTLYAVGPRGVERLAEGVTSAAPRAIFPPPPAAPATIPNEAPA